MLSAAFITQCVSALLNLSSCRVTCEYQTFFDTVPFRGTNDFQIMRLLAKGKRPDRLESPRMADSTWDLIQRCWESIPSKRPTMEQIMEMLTV